MINRENLQICGVEGTETQIKGLEDFFIFYKHVLHINVYMIMFVFVHMFIFWTYLPHIRENM
jgi:hypothetical protein